MAVPGEGHKPDTPGYFSHVERFLNLRDDGGEGPRRHHRGGGGDGEHGEEPTVS